MLLALNVNTTTLFNIIFLVGTIVPNFSSLIQERKKSFIDSGMTKICNFLKIKSRIMRHNVECISAVIIYLSTSWHFNH